MLIKTFRFAAAVIDALIMLYLSLYALAFVLTLVVVVSKAVGAWVRG